MWEKRKCAIKCCASCVGSGFSLHRFPKEEAMLTQWIEATNISYVSLNTLICGLHFKVSDYINSGK